MRMEVTQNGLKYGLSTLHAWIRSMECVLNIAYRIEVKKWSIRSDDDKEKVKKRKLEIQEVLKNSRFGLLVDVPKPGGSGTTNTGNVARRFFQNADDIADLIGFDKAILRRLHIILSCLSSGYTIDAVKLRTFVSELCKSIMNEIREVDLVGVQASLKTISVTDSLLLWVTRIPSNRC